MYLNLVYSPTGRRKENFIMKKINMYISLLVISILGLSGVLQSCNDIGNNNGNGPAEYLTIKLKKDLQYQSISSFGASDAWSCQFVGQNWPEDKKEQIADLLFSTELGQDGSPLGIGLTSWRFNIGAGSADQGNESGIGDEWRRAEGFMKPDGSYDWNSQAGQRWFLNAARDRGVDQFYAFMNSPPVALTRNSRAYSSDGNAANISPDNYDQYVLFLTDVINHLNADENIALDLISPVNEPQWEWTNASQEGSPWTNVEIAELVKKLNAKLLELNIETDIELPEAAQIEFLYKRHNYTGKDNQLRAFFNPGSSTYLGDLEKVHPKVAAHSYFSTWDPNYMVTSRRLLAAEIEKYPGLEYTMSEYTLLEDNSEIKGNGRDLGMDAALYMARVLHTDIVVAQATSWQWWLAISPYDYKDGLVYISKNKQDGDVYESKMLWALGNYSRFVEPGMKRIGNSRSDLRGIEETLEGVMVSSFIDPDTDKSVTVAINYSRSIIPVKIESNDSALECEVYRTAAGNDNLTKLDGTDFKDSYDLVPRSVTTFVEK